MKRHLITCHDLKENDMKDGNIDSLRASRCGALPGSPASRHTDTPHSTDEKVRLGLTRFLNCSTVYQICFKCLIF